MEVEKVENQVKQKHLEVKTTKTNNFLILNFIMKRSKWKGPFITSIKNLNISDSKKSLKKVPRSLTIIPKFIGHDFKIHTGNTYSEILVTKEMVGHKFGEFSATRKSFTFKKKKKK